VHLPEEANQGHEGREGKGREGKRRRLGERVHTSTTARRSNQAGALDLVGRSRAQARGGEVVVVVPARERASGVGSEGEEGEDGEREAAGARIGSGRVPRARAAAQ
jgi:hypothetical protein